MYVVASGVGRRRLLWSSVVVIALSSLWCHPGFLFLLIILLIQQRRQRATHAWADVWRLLHRLTRAVLRLLLLLWRLLQWRLLLRLQGWHWHLHRPRLRLRRDTIHLQYLLR